MYIFIRLKEEGALSEKFIERFRSFASAIKKDVSADSYWHQRHSTVFHPYSQCQHHKKIGDCELKMNLNLASLIQLNLL
jgi:hypothetical protein